MATKQKRYVKVKVRVGNKFLVKWKDTKTGKTYWNKPIFDHTRQSKPGLGVPTDEKTTERQKKGWKGSKEFNKSQSGGELGVGKALTQVKETKPPTKDEGYGAYIRGQQKKTEAEKLKVNKETNNESNTNSENKADKLKSTDPKKPLGTETKEQYLERTKNSPAAKGGVGKEQRWAAYQNYLRFKEKKRSSKEERRKRRDALLEKKKNSLKIGKK